MPQNPGYDPLQSSIGGLFPPGATGAPKPPMGQQLPGMAPQPQMGGDPQRTALLQALAQKIGMGRGGV